jgi:hypothetical protein
MEQTQEKRKRGRPRQNMEGRGDGNPMLLIRLSREDLEKIQALGGAKWARPILLAAMKEQQQ